MMLAEFLEDGTEYMVLELGVDHCRARTEPPGVHWGAPVPTKALGPILRPAIPYVSPWSEWGRGLKIGDSFILGEGWVRCGTFILQRERRRPR
jgi:hypothetical protein